jgi:thiamine transport system permease protein
VSHTGPIETAAKSRRGLLGRRALLWLPPAAFLLLFFYFPLARILTVSFRSADLPAAWAEAGPLARSTLAFTLEQAVLSTALTLLVGLPLAWFFARYTFRGKALLHALTAVPFMLPTVVVAAGFNALLGPRGWVNLSLMQAFNLTQPPIAFVGTLAAILVAHVFYNTTIVVRVVGSTWSQLDPRLVQAARVLGATPVRAFRSITLPLLRPALLAATLLVFLFDFTSFGVILLLGAGAFRTLEVEIYIQSLRLLNLPVAALLSLIQLLATGLVLLLYSRAAARLTPATGARTGLLRARHPRSRTERLFSVAMVTLIFLLFILPMAALPARSVVQLEPARGERGAFQPTLTLENYKELFINPRGSVFYVPPARAIAVSLIYAAITTILAVGLGFPAASVLARPGPLERLLDPFLMLSLGASAVTLGLGYILAFGRPPFAFLGSPLLIPMAHTTVALPLVLRTLQPALAAIPQRLREAASSLGAAPRRAWLAVDLPIVARAALSAGVFAFTASLGEFGATAMLVRPQYPTMTIAISRFLSQPGGLNYGQAMAMATILLVVCASAILLIERIKLPGVDLR